MHITLPYETKRRLFPNGFSFKIYALFGWNSIYSAERNHRVEEKKHSVGILTVLEKPVVVGMPKRTLHETKMI
jgi:hypothetical protein